MRDMPKLPPASAKVGSAKRLLEEILGVGDVGGDAHLIA